MPISAERAPNRFGRIGRIIGGRPRLFLGFAFSLLTGAVMARWVGPKTDLLLAWDSGVSLFLLLALFLFLTEPVAGMPVRAEREEEGEWTIFGLTVAAAVFSLVAIFGVFAFAKGVSPLERSLRTALVAATLVLSWLMLQTTFAFRYAHEYYAADRAPPAFDAGLEFPGEPAPDYMDFLYFSLVLGMTFQVSDVQITAGNMRRLALLHGLLSFLFNTVILALTVNVAAGLL